MIYLFSSQPKTLIEFFTRKSMKFVLIDKPGFDKFVTEYIPQEEDLGIVCDFGKFIPQALLDRMLFLNVHFSMLPKYRGAIPVEAAILAGERKTGISIQRMVSKMDQGDLLVQHEVEIQPEWTSGELQSQMYAQLPLVLEKVFDKPQKEWKFTPQKGEGSVCYIRWLDRGNAQLKPEELTASEFVSRVLGYNPEPFAWMIMENRGKRVEVNILKAEILGGLELEAGKLQFVKKRGLAVGTKEGTVLITELIVAGSKPLHGGDIVALKGSLAY